MRGRGGFWRLLTSVAVAFFVALPAGAEEAVLQFFWANNCPHCLEAKPQIEALSQRYPGLELRQYEVWDNPDNYRLMMDTAARLGQEQVMTPMVVFGDRIWFGYSPEIATAIEQVVGARFDSRIKESPADSALNVPLLGEVEAKQVSLPVLAVTLGLLDSFNPCAFFVLFFLLSLLVHAHSRRTMLLVGGTFVVFSGLVYFLFMAAWLNLFFLIGHIRFVTTAAALLALVFALINIKDFFFFRAGVTLSIPEGAKPGLYRRMRALVRSSRLPAVLTGTIFLALTANSYELLCTAGFPMVFTRVLTLQQLPAWSYYGYLGLYNLVYVVPLAVIVGFFAWTLGSRKLSEWQGRVLKLLSGCMMLAMALVLLYEPVLLTDLKTAASLLGSALLATAAIALICKRRDRRRNKDDAPLGD